MKQIANLFYEQCVGSYSGHMAAIDYHPTIAAIVKVCLPDNSCGQPSKEAFAKILKGFAAELEVAAKIERDEIPF